jgi:hypothetical protein
MSELGVDPFEILLYFAKGDWKALGYDTPSTQSFTSAGIEYEDPIITPELRLQAAKEACQYVLPKRKATEMTVVDEARMKEIERMSEMSDADLEQELKRMGFERVRQ